MIKPKVDVKAASAFITIVLIGLLTYSFMFLVGKKNLVPFNKINYQFFSHHYIEDPRAYGEEWSLLASLGQYDAQWYLKIASEGYPKDNNIPTLESKEFGGLPYAFFPLHPLTIRLLKPIGLNINTAAFTVSLIMQAAAFVSLYWVVKKLYNHKVAINTLLLILLYPFSIFFRGYFPESLYLLLFVWFTYFLIKKKHLHSAVLLGLLNITKANGFLLNFLFIYYLYKGYKEKEISASDIFLAILFVILPFLVWMSYVYIQTGDPLFFNTVRVAWVPFSFPFTFAHNLTRILSFPKLAIHSFYNSKVEIISFLLGGTLLWASWKKINKILWLSTLCLWIFPFFTSVFMSFSRYQIVLFPLAIYLAKALPEKAYLATILISWIMLLVVSAYYINWYWIG